jgi:NADH-ubiquinone oxidoreductase chain 5
VGDVGLLLGIGFFYSNIDWTFVLEDFGAGLVCLFIILAGFAKRAQIPFSAWLPAAMAAPTPVRSLVHSSTLVTAGVYLLIRFYRVISSSGLIRIVVVRGIVTSLAAGFIANFEVDVKKIVALSTLSHLGLIVFVLGLGRPDLAFFHLIVHAIFKSVLFICIGVFIHNSNGAQDYRICRKSGCLRPILSSLFIIDLLRSIGCIFLSGFYRKDIILERINRTIRNIFIKLFLRLILVISIGYRTRLIFFFLKGY